MSAAIYTTWGDGNAALAEVTHPNHAAYAAAHGYERIADRIPYEEAHLGGLARIRELLARHDWVLSHGTDVLFMNLRWEFPSLNRGESVTLAREKLGWWPINNDVMLWQASLGAESLLDLLIRDEPVWRDYAWKWQTHLWNLMQERPALTARTIRLADPHEMNATPYPGESLWQLGDPIVHFLSMSMERRVATAQAYLAKVGDGTWKR